MTFEFHRQIFNANLAQQSFDLKQLMGVGLLTKIIQWKYRQIAIKLLISCEMFKNYVWINNWCESVFRPKSHDENFVKLRRNFLFYMKSLKITFEFHRQIFKPNLAQTIIWLKTINVIPFLGQNLTMKISSNCIVIPYFTWKN